MVYSSGGLGDFWGVQQANPLGERLFIMSVATDPVLVEKTRVLCQAILDNPVFLNVQDKVNTFMAHDQAQALYRNVRQKGEELQQKQQSGQPLTDAEIDAFEKQREALFAHPVAREFIDAQETLHAIKKMVTQHVTKTMELGRMPSEADFEATSCGSGCHCH